MIEARAEVLIPWFDVWETLCCNQNIIDHIINDDTFSWSQNIKFFKDILSHIFMYLKKLFMTNQVPS